MITVVHERTPKLTHHARVRCEQMDVRTGRVKTILRQPTMTYSSGEGRLAWWDGDPDIAVVFVDQDGQRVALTVVPRTYETYERPSR